ncbi:MAG: hypothetical protein RJQ08_12025 [Salinisphaeraceae bacterium]
MLDDFPAIAASSKPVYILGEGGVGQSVLKHQLEVYCSRVALLRSREQLAQALDKEAPLGVLIGVDRLNEARDVLRDYLDAGGNLIALADEDTLESRVFAAGHGCIDFFVRPVFARTIFDKLRIYFLQRQQGPFRILAVSDRPDKDKRDVIFDLIESDRFMVRVCPPEQVLEMCADERPEAMVIDGALASYKPQDLARALGSFIAGPAVVTVVHRQSGGRSGLIRIEIIMADGGHEEFMLPGLVPTIDLLGRLSRGVRSELSSGFFNNAMRIDAEFPELSLLTKSCQDEGLPMAVALVGLDKGSQVQRRIGYAEMLRITRELESFLRISLDSEDRVHHVSLDRLMLFLPGKTAAQAEALLGEQKNMGLLGRMTQGMDDAWLADAIQGMAVSAGISETSGAFGLVDAIQEARRGFLRAQLSGGDRVVLQASRA